MIGTDETQWVEGFVVDYDDGLHWIVFDHDDVVSIPNRFFI